MNATVNRRMPRCVVRVFRLHEVMNMNSVNQTTRKYQNQRGSKYVNELLITDPCIITSDKLCKSI